MRKIVLALALPFCLVGCHDAIDSARYTSDHAVITCRDHVQYLVVTNSAMTPHLRPDGKPFTC